MGVSTDALGNVYVTGYFASSTLSFGSTTLTNAGANDIFIANYDANGNVLWAKSAGGTSYDDARSVSTDALGNVYVTGWFGSPTLTFGSTTLTNAGAAGTYDIFTAKLNGITGIEENNLAEEINVFPNPCSGKFTVQFSDAFAPPSTPLRVTSIEITNVLGEVEYRSSVNGSPRGIISNGVNRLVVDLSGRPQGIYFIRIKTAEGFDSYREVVKKIVKE